MNTNPLSRAHEDARLYISRLRTECLIPRSALARAIGMSLTNLVARDFGRVPWKPAEVKQVRMFFAKHREIVDDGICGLEFLRPLPSAPRIAKKARAA